MKSNVDKLDIDKFKNVPSGLRSLKLKVDKLSTDKLETTPADSGKLINVVNNDIVKKTEYDELVKKLNAIKIVDNSVKNLTITQI